MSRLQKKCFIGATSMHVLLFVVLIVGPGFFSKDDPMDESDVLTFIPLMATESGRAGGGAPQPPTPAPPVIQQPTQTLPPIQQRVTEPVRDPEPPQVRQPVREVEQEKEKPAPRDNRESLDPKPDKNKKHEVKVNRNIVRVSPNRATTTTPTTSNSNAQEQRQREQLANAIARSGSRVRENLSSTTEVSMPDGPGGGGASYAAYGQIVRKRYADAWVEPIDMAEDQASVTFSTTISRDGKVITKRITIPSNSTAANRSIERLLDRVADIGVPFPQSTKDSQQTFILKFNLKAKKGLG